MKAKPVTYKGINFRSKLEARWYIFMNKLGWKVEYEPDIEGLSNWIPDFLIIGNDTKVLVEVKPFLTEKEFDGQYARDTIKKITNSNWLKLNFDAVLLVGSTLNLTTSSAGAGTFVGGTIIRPTSVDENNPQGFYTDNFVYTDHSQKIGVCDEWLWFQDVINNSHEGGHCLDTENNERLEIAWNEAWSKLQWKPQ